MPRSAARFSAASCGDRSRRSSVSASGSLPCRPEHQREVLAHAGVGAGLRGGLAQHPLALGETFRERVGQAEVRQHARLVRHDPQRRDVVLLGERVVVHLVGDRALGREDAPVRPLRQVGAAEHVRGLLQPADVGQRLAVRAEHPEVLRVADRPLLQDGQRLGVLPEGPQGARIADGRFGIARVGLEPPAPGDALAPPHVLGRRRAADRPRRPGPAAQAPRGRRAKSPIAASRPSRADLPRACRAVCTMTRTPDRRSRPADALSLQ